MAKELVDLFNISKQEIDGDLSHYKFTVSGAFGSGKSTFANALFNRIGSSVMFGFENRFKGIEGIRVIPIETWDDAIKYRKMLVKGFRENKGENPFDFNNIIFYPVGIAAKMCEDYVCKKNDWETLADGGYGKGYSVFEDEFNGYISSLQRLGFTISYDVADIVRPVMGDDLADYIKRQDYSAEKHLQELKFNSDFEAYEASLDSNSVAFSDIANMVDELMDYINSSKRLNRDKLAEKIRYIGKTAANQY